MEARLHTAVSSSDVYSMISVHRLEHLMVPRFCLVVVGVVGGCWEGLEGLEGLRV